MRDKIFGINLGNILTKIQIKKLYKSIDIF